MSLARMLAAQTDEALAALASKGLVRRAAKELGAGRFEITDRGEETARVTTDGETVQIGADGPGKASCTCPASGVCRHILLAVMALRAAGDSADESGDTAEATAEATQHTTAAEEIAALGADALIRFAGADWAAAVGRAEAATSALITQEGPNRSVTLDDEPAPVVFVAGQPLKDALYKGPASRRRAAITVAAILLRQQAGLKVEAEPAETAPAGPDPELLATMGAALERAVAAVLAGDAATGRDRLFDLAISARIDAAPRLGSMLRALAAEALLGAERHVAFRADRFLRDGARARALIDALIRTPEDPGLAGTLRRDYAEEPGTAHLWLLGARVWRTEAGARGLRLHLYDRANARWLQTGPARAAGADPTFDAATAYRGSLWTAGTIPGLMGHAIDLADPRVSSDRQLADAQGSQAAPGAPVTLDALEEANAVHTAWDDARTDLAARFGSGLTRGGRPEAVVLAPSSLGNPQHDDIAGRTLWPATDAAGDTLMLSLPGIDTERLRQTGKALRAANAILAEAVWTPDGLGWEPVALLTGAKDGLQVWNIGLDSPRAAPSSMRAGLREMLARSGRADLRPGGRLAEIAAEALDAALDGVGGAGGVGGAAGSTPDTLRTAGRAGALGLGTLERALERLSGTPTIGPAMAVAYLAGEVQAEADLAVRE